jgi:CRP-like cAMP-binding protein
MSTRRLGRDVLGLRRIAAETAVCCVVAMPERRSQATDLTDRLLAGIEPEARRAILAGSHRRTIQPAQVLCRTGEPADRLFLLRKGRVRLGRLSSTGREVVLGILGPGDMFGLGSVLAANVDYIGTAEVMGTTCNARSSGCCGTRSRSST